MPQFKTLQFPNTAKGQAAKIRTLERETANGWRVVSETIAPGKFKGANACCLFLIFAPCAFLAGHEDDIINITLEKDDALDSPSSPEFPSVQTSSLSPSDRARWKALLEYDQEIKAAAEPLRSLDPRWMDEFAAAYMALNEKQYLAQIVQRILERASVEQAEKERLKKIAQQQTEAARVRELERRTAEEQARQRSRQVRQQKIALLLNAFWGTKRRKILAIGVGFTGLVVVGVLTNRTLFVRSSDTRAPAPLTTATPVGPFQSTGIPAKEQPQPQLSVLTPPTKISWSAKTDGDPKAYRIGDLNITLTSRPSPTDNLPVPVVKVSSLGNFSSIEVPGEPGFEAAAAELLIGQLDPKNAENDVMFLTYTGGAHCCTNIKIIHAAGNAWRSVDIGDWDSGELSTFPKDIDGDHIPDIVLYDGRFNYAFAPYAESYAPPLIFNMVGGSVLDVSANPRYANFFRQLLTKYQAGCLLHQNGACAAFVAVASRINLHDYAWRYMQSYYDRNDTWELPKKCDVAKTNGNCPRGHETTPADFPTALATFLVENSYYNPAAVHRAESVKPSFNCAAVHSQVLSLVCADSELSVADQDLAAAYLAAQAQNSSQATNSSHDNLKRDEQAWISRRNNSRADRNALLQMYEDRIAVLTRLANERSASPPPSAP